MDKPKKKSIADLHADIISEGEVWIRGFIGELFMRAHGKPSASQAVDGMGQVLENWHYLVRDVESAIELRLAPFLAAMMDDSKFVVTCVPDPKPSFWTLLVAQAHFKVGRVDFAFFCHADNCVRVVVVECDGHEFHERTKEQAERDRSRDRWFQQNEIVVLRYTGSEIFRDAAGCAQQIEDVLGKVMARVRGA